jgi:hypothetical protein
LFQVSWHNKGGGTQQYAPALAMPAIQVL